MLTGKLFFTMHAIERFRERWAPELSLDAARAALVALSETATVERQKCPHGEERWRAENGAVFVVAHDAHFRLPTCKTVLSVAESASGHHGGQRRRGSRRGRTHLPEIDPWKEAS